jgi:hypothetical protein
LAQDQQSTDIGTAKDSFLEIQIEGSFHYPEPVKWTLNVETVIPSATLPFLCPDSTAEAGTQKPMNGATNNQTVRAGYFGKSEAPLFSPTIGHQKPLAELFIDGAIPGVIKAGVPVAVADIALCWSKGAPIRKQNQYFGATIPLVQGPGAFGFESQIPTTAVILPSDGTEKYSLQSQSQPSISSNSLNSGDKRPLSGWQWDNASGLDESIGAIDVAENQADAYHGFLSGVLLGIAGAAVIGLLTVLLEPIRPSHREQKRPAEGS